MRPGAEDDGRGGDAARVTGRQILALAVPALGALVAEPLFVLADSAIVGHLGAGQLAGLGTAGAALNTLVGVCIFLAYSTTAQVSRLIGAGRRREGLARGVDGMYLAAGLGLLLAVVGVLFAGPIVRWLGAGAQAAPYAATYLRVSSLGLPGMLLVLAATGLLRGLHDMRTPLLVAAVAAVVNTLANWVLVYPCGFGIAGSAAGTASVQTAMAVAYAYVVVKACRAEGVVAAGERAGPARLAVGELRAAGPHDRAADLPARGGLGRGPARHGRARRAHHRHQPLGHPRPRARRPGDRGAGAGRARARGRAQRAGAGRGGADEPVGARVRRDHGARAGRAQPRARPVFTGDHAVGHALVPVLLVAALFQPAAGVVFVLDGVLIGAGDTVYLAWASLACTAVFLGALAIVLAAGWGLTWLWVASGCSRSPGSAALGGRGHAWMRAAARRRVERGGDRATARRG
jgi:Na+-driven multidrug efflux pump